MRLFPHPFHHLCMYLLSFILSFHLSFPSISIVKGTRQTITQPAFASPHRLENPLWNSTGFERQITMSLRPRSVIFTRSQGRSRRSGPRRDSSGRNAKNIMNLINVHTKEAYSILVCGYTLKSVWVTCVWVYSGMPTNLLVFFCFYPFPLFCVHSCAK